MLHNTKAEYCLSTCLLSAHPHQQVDLIVCCDSAAPGRLQQRSGRTGRHRPGRVVHLLLEGKEVDAYYSNRDKKAQVAVRVGFGCVRGACVCMRVDAALPAGLSVREWFI